MYRAVNGVEEAVWHKGVAVGTRVRHDNRVLFAMLRARDPLNYAPLDELERWEARRVAAADPHALADELEREEEAWGHAPKDELEAAGRLPLHTATLALEREEEVTRRAGQDALQVEHDAANERMFAEGRAEDARNAERDAKWRGNAVRP